MEKNDDSKIPLGKGVYLTPARFFSQKCFIYAHWHPKNWAPPHPSKILFVTPLPTYNVVFIFVKEGVRVDKIAYLAGADVTRSLLDCGKHVTRLRLRRVSVFSSDAVHIL